MLKNEFAKVIILAKDICESGAMTAYSPCIANVNFGGIDNVPLPADWTPFGTADTVSYTDYTQSVAPAVLVKGQTYSASITNSFTGTSSVKLYKYIAKSNIAILQFCNNAIFLPCSFLIQVDCLCVLNLMEVDSV